MISTVDQKSTLPIKQEKVNLKVTNIASATLTDPLTEQNTPQPEAKAHVE